jgi:hypothetical protein
MGDKKPNALNHYRWNLKTTATAIFFQANGTALRWIHTPTHDHWRPTRDQYLDAAIAVLIHTPRYRSVSHRRQVARMIGVRYSRVQPIWTLSVRSRRPTNEWRVLWSWDQRLMFMHIFKGVKFKRNSQSRDKTPTKSCVGVERGVVRRSLAMVARPRMNWPYRGNSSSSGHLLDAPTVDGLILILRFYDTLLPP